jgi:uncharacterized membrane protein
MKRIFQLLLRPGMALPTLSLTIASAVTVGLVLARITISREGHLKFLIWNLFLAWLPLIFAVLACDHYGKNRKMGWKLFGLAGVWLLFFPNAAYIFTDVIHLSARHFWIDLTLVLICALTGLMIGFVSLYLMQTIAARIAGRWASWLFVLVVASLGSFGVYIGRFARVNSWDVFRPLTFYRRLEVLGDGLWISRGSMIFLVLFAAFLFFTYLMLYAMTHLSPAGIAAEDSEE